MGIFDWISAGVDLWDASERNNKDLKTQAVPMTPEQRAIYDQARGYTQPGGSPTRNAMYPMIGSILSGYGNLGWNSPQTKDIPGGAPGMGGMTGYAGTGPQGGFDWAGMAARMAQTGAGGPGGPGIVPPGNNPPPGTPPFVGNGAGDGIWRGGNGRNPLNRMEPPDDRPGMSEPIFSDELPGGGRVGEGIGNWLDRNPGGNIGANLPGGGQGTQGPPPGMSYGEGADIGSMFTTARTWLQNNPQSVAGLRTVLMGLGWPGALVATFIGSLSQGGAPTGSGTAGLDLGSGGDWGRP